MPRNTASPTFLLVTAYDPLDGPTGPIPGWSVSGTWVGSEGGRTLEITLVSGAGSVSGSGTLSDDCMTPAQTHLLAIEGSYRGPSPSASLVLRLSSPTTTPMALEAFLDGNALLARLVGGPFAATADLTLIRA